MRGLLPLSVACSLVIACGGGTPEPKSEDEAPAAASASKDKDTGDSKDSKDSDSNASASASSPAKSDSPPADTPPATTDSKSGDLAMPKDDVWSAPHQMPPKDVLKTMRPLQNSVHACFKAGYKRDSSASGDVKVKFVVSNDGAVKAVKDDGSTMTDGDVTKCVSDVVQKQKFPKQKSPGDAWATYNANFAR
ncbi:MAG: AgmX/PglI C-terminal domain-containing protein [Polyangiaceae bacterium]